MKDLQLAYKRTGLNILPSDWEFKALDDIGVFLRGSGISRAEVLEEGIPCIRYGEIYTDYDFFVHTPKSFINRESATRSKQIANGDILFTSSGETLEEIGKCVAYLSDEEAYAGGDIIIFRLSEGDAKFFAFLLNHDVASRQKYRFGQGQSVVHVYPSQLKDLIVPFPPRPEQEKIAEILGTWDEAIGLTERLIALEEQRKKGLMQRLLTGQVRFPEFVRSHEYRTAFSSQVPKDWNVLEFGQFALRRKDRFNPKKSEKSYKCIELEHISQNTGQILGCTNTSEQRSTKNVFSKNDILFGKLRPYLRKFTKPDFDGVCSSEIWVLTGKKNLCLNEYLFYLIQTDRFIKAANVTSGTKMPRSDWGFVSEFAFVIPEVEEQRKIAAVLQTCDEKITLLQQKLAALQQQKKGLMQRLLTGRVRVRV